MKIATLTILAAAAVASAAQSSQASVATSLASDDATIKNAGPRTGASGKSFFNVEGDNNLAANASYGIIDFSGANFHVTGATTVTALTLTLTESNAAFSTPGSVEVYLASDSTADIQPGTSSLIYNLALTPEGIGATSAFGALTDLGSIAFNTTGNVNNGTADSLVLNSLSPAVSTFLAGKLAGGTIRLVLTPNTAATSATWAGFSNTTSTTLGPILALTSNGAVAVPEPASVSLLLGGALLLTRRRRGVN